jgi:glycosyltransferase involved in cell wall biosynthesis
VIAYKAGGALDTVIEGKTGVFFDKQSTESLKKAVKKFEKISFNQKDLIENAKRFSKQRFKREILRATKHG